MASLSLRPRAVRASIGDAGQVQQIIQTRRGYGYQCVVGVSEERAGAPEFLSMPSLLPGPEPPLGTYPCFTCQHLNRDDANFCVRCGTRQRQTCAVCGQHVVLPAKFCAACGRPLTSLPLPGPTTVSAVASWPPTATSIFPPQLEHSSSLIARVKTVPPFIGRRQEYDWFTYSLQDVCTGMPRVVLIPGEAGIGKTRLLNEVQALARRSGFQVYHGRCYEGALLPHLPFVEALRMQLEQFPGEREKRPDAAVEIMQQLLPRATDPTTLSNAFTTAQTDEDRIRLFLAISHTSCSHWPIQLSVSQCLSFLCVPTGQGKVGSV